MGKKQSTAGSSSSSKQQKKEQKRFATQSAAEWLNENGDDELRDEQDWQDEFAEDDDQDPYGVAEEAIDADDLDEAVAYDDVVDEPLLEEEDEEQEEVEDRMDESTDDDNSNSAQDRSAQQRQVLHSLVGDMMQQEKTTAKEYAATSSRKRPHIEIMTDEQAFARADLRRNQMRESKRRRILQGKRYMQRQWPFKPEWQRPAFDMMQLRQKDRYVEFMMTAVDYYTIETEPFIRFYGVTKQKQSVTVHMSGNRPYLYAQTPTLPKDVMARDVYTKEVLEFIRGKLNNLLRQQQQQKPNPLQPWLQKFGGNNQLEVLDVELQEKTPIYGYHGPTHKINKPLTYDDLNKYPVLKITCNLPGAIPKVRDMFHKKQLKNCFGFDAQPLKTYESNIPYTMRVMVDMDIVGGQWIRIPLAECEWIEDDNEAQKKKATEENFANFAHYRNLPYGATIVPNFTRKAETSIELSIDYQYVRPIPVKAEVLGPGVEGPIRYYDNSVAPMRTLGVDIECHGKDGHFPKPAYREELVQKVLKDPNALNDEQYERMIKEGGDEVIQIGNVFWDHGTGKQEKVIFVLGSCAPIEGATVYTFDDEREMLLRWRHFVRWIDPDIITGYNLVNFDLRYLMKRAAILGLQQQFFLLGRISQSKSKLKAQEFSSKARGTRRTERTLIPGVLVFDLLEVMIIDEKFESLKLGFVAQEITGETKSDLHHSDIPRMHKGSAEDRRTVAEYCLQDVWLCFKIIETKIIFFKYIEMARVTGVQLGT